MDINKKSYQMSGDSIKTFLMILVIATILVARNSDAQDLPASAEPQASKPLSAPDLKKKIDASGLDVAPFVAKAPTNAENIFFSLQQMDVEGVIVFLPEELERIYGKDIGTKISLLRVYEIADLIQKKYRKEGYFLARVVVPPQSIEDGLVRIQVVEGSITSIRVEGEIGPVKKRVEQYLQKVVTDRPAREQDLERYLLLANDIPGVSALGVLRRGVGEVGSSELIVEVQRKAYGGYALANNRGSKFTGPGRAVVAVRENSATERGEQIEAMFFNTLFNNEQRYAQFSYRQLIGDEGMTAGLLLGLGWSEPGFTLEPLDIETDSLRVDASVAYPIIRSRKKNLYVDGGFQIMNSEVDALGTQITKDKLRVLYANLTYDFRDQYNGQSLVGVGLRQGLDAFGASDKGGSELSRAEGVPDFTTLSVKASRYQMLSEEFGVYVAGTGQYAFNTLLSDAEFRVGGEQFGRGYDPSELSGDHGLGLTAEVQYSMPMPYEIWNSIQGYGFYDLGAVWNKDTSSVGRESLSSAGFGVRNRVLGQVYADLEVAFPLTRNVATQGDTDPRLFLQLMTSF